MRPLCGGTTHSRPHRPPLAYLTRLQTTTFDLGGVPSKTFFESLLQMTIEGYFCDPVYGGNKGMAAWAMIVRMRL